MAEITASVEHEEDRAMAVIALAVVAVSGFVAGLLVQGAVVLSLLALILATGAGLAGWWMRGGL